MSPYKILNLDDLPNEMWVKSTVSNDYMVSNLGRIKSNGFKNYTQRILSQHIVRKYLQVSLQINKKQIFYKSHRLIALAFIPNPFKKEQVNHKNGDKLDNRVENLEWVTLLENQQHRHLTKLVDVRGENNNKAKLTNQQVVEIFESTGSSLPISIKYNISRTVVHHIRNGMLWSSVTGAKRKYRKDFNPIVYGNNINSPKC